MGILLAPFLIGRGDDPASAAHGQPFGGDPAGKPKARLHLHGIGLGHSKLVEFLRAERMTCESESNAGGLFKQDGAIAAIGVVRGREVRRRPAVERYRIIDEFRQMAPEPLLVQEARPPAVEADDAQIVSAAGVVLDRCRELGPVRVLDPPGQDIDPVPGGGHRLCDLLHIDELPAEIGMFGQVRVRRIEIALRIEKDNLH